MVDGMEDVGVAFRERVRAALSRAARSGQDPVEYLDRYGLLASPQWQSKVEVNLLVFLADAMEEAYRQAPTPDGAFVSAATVRRLRELAKSKIIK